MTDYTIIPDAEWAAKTDGELAEQIGVTRQAVSHQRRRLGKPAGPLPRGRPPVAKPDDAPNVVTVGCGTGQKRRWMAAHKLAKKPFQAWASAALDAEAARLLREAPDAE